MEYILFFDEISKKDVPIVGGKCANLGEMTSRARVPVPYGFATTSDAYRLFLKENKLWGMIEKELRKVKNINDTKTLKQAGKKIRNMIIKAKIPAVLEEEVRKAYKMLGSPYVSVRSSATAEDLPSIPGNTPVLIAINENVVYDSIENIYNNYNDCSGLKVKIPTMVGNNTKWGEVEQLYKHPCRNKKLYKITTETGREITVSPNHSLIILNKETLKPKTACISEVDEGDFIPVTKKLDWPKKISVIDTMHYLKEEKIVEKKDKIFIKNSSNNWKIQNALPRFISLTNDFAYFLGIYAAEGSTYKNNCVTITNSNKEVMERALKFLKDVSLYKGQRINKHSLRVYCKTLVKLLHATCGKPLNFKGKGRSCKIKRIPGFVFNAGPEFASHFLRGCFDGDGSISKEGISYYSTSEMLIGGVAKLLELLGINFYIKRKKKVMEITIPLSEAHKFKELIGTEIKKNKSKLRNITEEYFSKKKHPEFKGTIEINEKLSKKIKEAYNTRLEKKIVTEHICPLCNEKINKTSSYHGKIRYYCKKCRKSFYEKQVKKREIEKYVNYDKKGRFLKNSIPWNKALIKERYSQKRFKELMEKYGVEELKKPFNGSILWDKIKKIEPLKYNGWVYDFTVPGIENFASGIGGVITHNSASFAGQQETYLNVKGSRNVLESIKKCYASLFTDRAIFYRQQKGFSHSKVALSVAVQKMVNSQSSGVMFTLDVRNGDPSKIIIEGSWGLGEYIVQGRVTPDNFVVRKRDLKILEKHIADKQVMLKTTAKGVVEKKVPKQLRDKPVLTDSEIRKLAGYGLELEKHYNHAQDVEWAKDENGAIYIVQTRPETVWSEQREKKETEIKGKILLKGLPASPGIGAGKVKVILKLSEIGKIKEGDVLVTRMTNPDMVPAMKKAEAIITDEGGVTSHAAIVSRELGIPCIVGTETATKELKEGQEVTVDGEKGVVYKGIIKEAKEKKKFKHFKTKTKIYVNMGIPEIADRIAKKPADGVGLMREEFIIATYVKEHPLSLIEKGKQAFFVKRLVKGIEEVAKAFKPRPVILRFSDLKTNEYRELKNGEKYEPHEHNPMIGWRGCSRYISPEYEEAFRLELKAVKEVRKKYKNLWVMLPFVRTISEVKKVISIMEEEGLKRSKDFKLFLMAEIPSNIFLADLFSQYCDGFSIGSNDLTQLTLGVDRDSEILGRMGEFDERNLAVKRAIQHLIKTAHKYGKTVGICGQAPSEYPDFARFLVMNNIDSISVNPDVVEKTRFIVHEAEKKRG